ncbi:hypothetical protein DFH06DRAFT_1337002 [Mycena polygramma]|nr:hypothetical protein DFH06DRAFT_1337002 [Mycena polygramma]
MSSGGARYSLIPKLLPRHIFLFPPPATMALSQVLKEERHGGRPDRLTRRVESSGRGEPPVALTGIVEGRKAEVSRSRGGGGLRARGIEAPRSSCSAQPSVAPRQLQRYQPDVSRTCAQSVVVLTRQQKSVSDAELSSASAVEAALEAQVAAPACPAPYDLRVIVAELRHCDAARTSGRSDAGRRIVSRLRRGSCMVDGVGDE